MTTVRPCEDQVEWDEEVMTLGGHPLQLWGWGETKAAHNWQVQRVFILNDEVIGVAQLLIRQLPAPFKAIVYVPRGPVCTESERERVLNALAEYAKKTYGAVAITVEPDWEGELQLKGWSRSRNTILIPRTLILDLSKTEDELLADMTKKTRQYVRKSGNEAVDIRQVKSREELLACLDVYRETAARAHFGIHDDAYYLDVFDNLGDHSPVFAVFSQGQPIAFLWLAISETTAFELYGGMNNDGQQLRVNYALKWYAIQMMKKWGIERYDFNGLLNDGVSTFKQGFASHETMLVGTYDKPLSPLYGVWSKALPMAKKVLQKINSR
jgi:peptidoglycan pentaglycine glycine transferase (the first glycine)